MAICNYLLKMIIIYEILKFTSNHLPQILWEKEFYAGNIYNKNGIKYSEILNRNNRY